MNPISFLVISFAIWTVAKGEWSKYFSLATTKGVTSSPSTSNATSSFVNPSGLSSLGNTVGALVPATANPSPTIPVTVNTPTNQFADILSSLGNTDNTNASSNTPKTLDNTSG